MRICNCVIIFLIEIFFLVFGLKFMMVVKLVICEEILSVVLLKICLCCRLFVVFGVGVDRGI